MYTQLFFKNIFQLCEKLSPKPAFSCQTSALLPSLSWRTVSKHSMPLHAERRCIALSSPQKWHTMFWNCTLVQDFSVEGVGQMFGGPIFRGSLLNFSIGQSIKILGNFLNICIEINKTLKNYWESSRKNSKFSENF